MPAALQARAMRVLLVVLGAAGTFGACRTSPPPTPPGVGQPSATGSEPAELAALRARPLRLPALASGERCPMTLPEPVDPPPPAGHPLSTGAPAMALGHAPIFPDARFYSPNPVRMLVRPDATDHGWFTAKAPWASRTGYLGWALIRTASLDGPGKARVELNLASGVTISEALAVNVQADWQFWPGAIHVTGPGCYAFQIDAFQAGGDGFTEVIVFRVELDPNGR